MKKENIERDYRETLDIKFIEKVGSPFKWEMPILGTGRKVQPVKDKKILVIRLEGCAEMYALNNAVTYVTDSKEKYDKFLEKVNDEKFGSDDTAVLIDYKEWKNIDKLMENQKFDVCIMNPPYDGTLHLQILEKALKSCDKVVNISPYTWAAKRNRWKTTFKKYLYTELVYPKSCEILSHRQSNDVFDLGNQIENLCISVYDRSTADKLDLLKFNFSDTEYSLYKKVLDDRPNKLVWRNGINIVTPESHDKIKAFVCPVNIWHGGATCSEAAFGSSANHKKGKIQFQAEFLTSAELENFKQFFQTKFMTWYYKNIVVPSDYKLHMTLFVLSDYTQPWTDERLCKFFNITGYVSDTEAEPGSEWAMILDCVKNN